LKSHNFFKGINFNSLHKSKSPLIQVFHELDSQSIDHFEDSDDEDHLDGFSGPAY